MSLVVPQIKSYFATEGNLCDVVIEANNRNETVVKTEKTREGHIVYTRIFTEKLKPEDRPANKPIEARHLSKEPETKPKPEDKKRRNTAWD